MSQKEEDAQGGDDRRRAERIRERCTVSFRIIRHGGTEPKRVAGETLNLSASGLCLVSPVAIAPDSQLALELELTGFQAPLMAIGRVVWCDQEAASYRVGICFTWLREEDRRSIAVIAEYVQSRL